MPKMKTSKSAAKRFKATGTGKLKRSSDDRRNKCKEYEEDSALSVSQTADSSQIIIRRRKRDGKN